MEVLATGWCKGAGTCSNSDVGHRTRRNGSVVGGAEGERNGRTGQELVKRLTTGHGCKTGEDTAVQHALFI